MRVAAATIAFLLMLSGCVRSTSTIVANGNVRLAEISTRSNARMAVVRAAWDADLQRLKSKLTADMIFAICDKKVSGDSPCGLLSIQYFAKEYIASFIRTNCPAEPTDADVAHCQQLFHEALLQAMRDRYGAEPVTDDGRSFVEIELDLVKEHNDVALAAFTKAANALRQRYTPQINDIIAEYDVESDRVITETRSELDSAQRKRAALLGVAAAMNSFGKGMTQTQVGGNSYPNAYTPPRAAASCSSDFECGMGSACVKDSGAFQGICAKTVNQYGTPTFEGPRPGSVGPGTGQCSFDTECPVGFACVRTTGGMYGNCLKR
jgi:hypothetical protein